VAPPDALRIVRQIAARSRRARRGSRPSRPQPANLFSVAESTADGGERIKILDFGVAKLGPI